MANVLGRNSLRLDKMDTGKLCVFRLKSLEVAVTGKKNKLVRGSVSALLRNPVPLPQCCAFLTGNFYDYFAECEIGVK